jgi:hypothetical protein
LIVPPDEVKLKASVIQAAFRDLDWIAPPPEHFLHVSVWVGATDELSIGYARRSEAADPLRTALRPFREVDLGTGIVDECCCATCRSQSPRFCGRGDLSAQ